MEMAREGIELMNQMIGNGEYSENFSPDEEMVIDEDSLISSLLMIKRSKLEEVVEKYSIKVEHKPKRYISSLLTEIAEKGTSKGNMRKIKRATLNSANFHKLDSAYSFRNRSSLSDKCAKGILRNNK